MNCVRCNAPMTFVDQYKRWWCERCKAYGDAATPPAPSAEQLQRAATARTLVMWSHILGWGGLVVLFVGAIVGGMLFGVAGASGAAGLGLVCAVVGGVLGQIGRGMQGRVI